MSFKDLIDSKIGLIPSTPTIIEEPNKKTVILGPYNLTFYLYELNIFQITNDSILIGRGTLDSEELLDNVISFFHEIYLSNKIKRFIKRLNKSFKSNLKIINDDLKFYISFKNKFSLYINLSPDKSNKYFYSIQEINEDLSYQNKSDYIKYGSILLSGFIDIEKNINTLIFDLKLLINKYN